MHPTQPVQGMMQSPRGSQAGPRGCEVVAAPQQALALIEECLMKSAQESYL